MGNTQAKVLSENLKVHKIEAPYYEQLHHEIFNRIEQSETEQRLTRHLEEPRGLRVLDYGCGTGNLTRALVHIGAIVTAADISPEMIALTQANLSKEIQAGLVQTLILLSRGPLAIGKFDCVAMYSVLHHLYDPVGAVR